MDSPINNYKKLSSLNNIKDIAYDTLFTKYIIRNLKNEDKRLELDTSNQEELMIQKNGGYPIPGFVYTFIYPPKPNSKVPIVYNNNVREYIDYVPIVFCTNINKTLSFKGINFNLLPNIERLKFLEIYYSQYKSFFNHIEDLTDNDKLAINKMFITDVFSNKGAELVYNFSKITNANFNYAYRNYDIKNIKQLRMIEYTEWDYIPFYDPIMAFKLMNHKQIYDLYWKTK